MSSHPSNSLQHATKHHKKTSMQWAQTLKILSVSIKRHSSEKYHHIPASSTSDPKKIHTICLCLEDERRPERSVQGCMREGASEEVPEATSQVATYQELLDCNHSKAHNFKRSSNETWCEKTKRTVRVRTCCIYAFWSVVCLGKGWGGLPSLSMHPQKCQRVNRQVTHKTHRKPFRTNIPLLRKCAGGHRHTFFDWAVPGDKRTGGKWD